MARGATEVSFIERHIITAAVTIMTALLIWIGTSTQKTAVQVAELRVEVRQISDFQLDINERVHELETEN